MRFKCMSCAARYSVPDDRVDAAGRGGLRIRCSACRAVMVVARDHPSVMPVIVDGAQPRDSHAPAPAALSPSGVYRALPGVERDVTGLHFAAPPPERASARIWYAAVGGRARGPYAATEMLALVDDGRIQGGSLVWRPGFAAWQRVRSDDESAEGSDLQWLARAVKERRRRELRAQDDAEKRGIRRVRLPSAPSSPSPPVRASGGGLRVLPAGRRSARDVGSDFDATVADEPIPLTTPKRAGAPSLPPTLRPIAPPSLPTSTRTMPLPVLRARAAGRRVAVVVVAAVVALVAGAAGVAWLS